MQGSPQDTAAPDSSPELTAEPDPAAALEAAAPAPEPPRKRADRD